MDSNFLCLSLSAMKQLFLPKPWSLFYWCLMYKSRHNYWCLYITILMTSLFFSFAQKLLKALNNKVLMSVLAYVIYFALYFFLLYCFLYFTINPPCCCCSHSKHSEVEIDSGQHGVWIKRSFGQSLDL